MDVIEHIPAPAAADYLRARAGREHPRARRERLREQSRAEYLTQAAKAEGVKFETKNYDHDVIDAIERAIRMRMAGMI